MVPEIPDPDLLRDYAENRAEPAFAEIVRRHVDAVYSAALRRVGGDVHLAQDVTQQVFATLAGDASRLSTHDHLVGWLYATTRNQAANVARLEYRRKRREQEAHLMHEQSQDEAPSSDWSQIAPLLDAVIDRLGETDRAAVLLRFIERKSFGTIGAALGVSEDAARMRVDRALDKLRIALQRRGVESTAAALGLALTQNVVHAAPAGVAKAVVSAGMTAPSATSVAGTIFSMSVLKVSGMAAIAAVLIVAIESSVGAHAYRERVERSLAEAVSDQTILAKRLRAAEEEAVAAERQLATKRREMEMAQQRMAAARVSVASAQTESTEQEWDAGAAGKAFLARHPDVKEALVAWLDAGVDADYGPLYPSLHLTPEKLEEFRALMRGGHSLGPSVGFGEKPLWLTDDGVQGKERERKLHELLGPDYHTFWLYRPSVSAREFVGALASQLTFSDAPLSAAAANQLRDIVVGNRTATRADGAKINWEAVRAQAATALTPTQLAAFDALRAQKQVDAVMNELAEKSAAKP